MTSKKLLLLLLLLFTMNGFAQSGVTEIISKDTAHYLITDINYPVAGTYLFEGGEPVVELNANGTGFFQTHSDPKRAINWGIESDEAGAPKFKKGFNSSAYTLWYQYTAGSASVGDEEWNAVEFTIHTNTLKMFIQGERVKDYIMPTEKK